MDYTDERLLLQSLKEGDENAYLYLVDRFNRQLYGYALSLTNDRAMAEDILQNVFIHTWEKRKKITIKTSMRNYLFRAVHNEFVSQYRKRQSALLLERKYSESLEKMALMQKENGLEKIIELITNEVQNLPPKCREVFILSRKEGLTNTEISEYLQVSVKTVEAHINKAFTILRDKLEYKYRAFLFLLFDVPPLKAQ